MRTLILIFLVLAARSAPGQQQRLIASITRQVQNAGPTLTFKLFREPVIGNPYYRIVVCSEDGARVLQEITGIRNGIHVVRQPHAFEVLDLDGNGSASIRLLGGFNPNDGKAWYKVWTYQPAANSYVFKPDA